ncbi:MAG TPA: hypothetical protein VM901_09035 [Bdellovibrionota bacterium]|jgi:Leucine-rich repeat (LRR) protein|nr:hypothetical protein [Bdellovibrionota bacterium]
MKPLNAKQLITLAMLAISGAAHADNPLIHIESVIRAGEDLKSIKVELKNTHGWDIYCPKMVVIAQVRDPEQYTQVGEARITLEDLYLNKFSEDGSEYSKRTGTSEIKRFERDTPAAIYTEFRLDTQLSSCQLATFETYVAHADRGRSEEHALKSVYHALDDNRPAEIQRRIGSIKRFNFSGWGLGSLKPLEFFYGLKELDVSNNPISNLKPVSSLVNLYWIDISGTKVETLRHLRGLKGQLRVRANGTPLKDASELDAFR